MTQTAEQHRVEAQAAFKEARDSFERCDTDGFLSQWASDLMGRQHLMEADLIEAGGVAEFPALFDVDTGERVAAKLIDGKYGPCWALCGPTDGQFTGVFVSAFPKREATMARKGYREGRETVAAYVAMRGNNACNVRPVHCRKDGGFPEGSVLR